MGAFLLVLLLGTAVGWAAKRARLPAAVGQVLLGLIIGPPLLGWVAPSAGLELLGQLGIVLLLGMAGLRLGLGHLAQAGWTGFWVAALGMLFSLAGGHSFAVWWGSPHAEALYVGTALTATSIGISVQVLHQFGLISSRIGRVIVAAAVIDDVAALYLLAVAHGTLSEDLTLARLVGSMALAGVLLAAVYLGCRWLARSMTRRGAGHAAFMRTAAAALIIVGFGWVTELAGYSPVVGAFFAGLGMGEGFEADMRASLHRRLDSLTLWLVPFFFVLIGTRAEWNVLGDPGMMTLVIGLLIIAVFGKTLGGMLGAIRTENFSGTVLIGLSMVPRGEVALVIAGLGFTQGHISHHVLVALILMTIGAALLGPLLMTPLVRRLGCTVKPLHDEADSGTVSDRGHRDTISASLRCEVDRRVIG